MREQDLLRLTDRLCDVQADIIFFPVRHHSPASARLIAQLIRERSPGAVLIEGPSDYNQHLDELFLDHELPIAIYSYFETAASEERPPTRRGVYYPFCEYSPEWVALTEGRIAGADIQFIDMPWSEVADVQETTHRYADGEMRRGTYIATLCSRLQVEDFDDLWDRMIESRDDLSVKQYLAHVHPFCLNLRLAEREVSRSDIAREAFMAEKITAVSRQARVPILVVTGGFHCGALATRLAGEITGLQPPVSLREVAGTSESRGAEAARMAAEQDVTEGRNQAAVVDRGTALTTYSYRQLDSLTGYDAGLPSPGFYEHAWRSEQTGDGFTHEPLLVELVEALRDRNQVLSTADLIAIETTARALSALRGRKRVWRNDLIDAVTSSLIKDELEYGCESPFIDAIHSVLRGTRRGVLASGTRVPPLVQDIQRQLQQLELAPEYRARTVDLDLLLEIDRKKSCVLHQLATLGVSGIRRDGGTDFLDRDSMHRLWESWSIRWTPEFESSCIEAARYGTKLSEAVAARLTELAEEKPRDAIAAARLLVQSAQAGVESLSSQLLDKLQSMLATEPQFSAAATALGHVLFLYCFDEALGTTGLADLEGVVREAFSRSLWLLELLGGSVPADGTAVRGMRSMFECFQRVGDELDFDAEEFAAAMRRVQSDAGKPAQVRGAAVGILWTMSQADGEAVLADLLDYSNPSHLGDFLTGLFALAREVAQRHPDFVRTIDELLLRFGTEEFQEALPSLRLAFTSFSPREKHHMLSTLFQSLGIHTADPLAAVDVDEATAAEALAVEERLFTAIARYGLQGEDRE